MDEDFSMTLKLLREQKLNIKNQLEIALSLEEKNKFLNMIYEIDDKIYNTTKKYEELKKSNISENPKMNNNIKKIKEIKDNKPICKKKFNKNIKDSAFDLNKEEVEEIINKKNYIPFQLNILIKNQILQHYINIKKYVKILFIIYVMNVINAMVEENRY